MAICPHCGREIPKDARYCPYCGKKIDRNIAEEIDIRIDDFVFHIKKTKNTMKVCGYNYTGDKDILGCSFQCSYIRPDTRAFYIKLIDLYREGFTSVVQKLLKYAGYEISKKEIEKRFKEAEEYLKQEAEKWERIKKAWGLNWFP